MLFELSEIKEANKIINNTKRPNESGLEEIEDKILKRFSEKHFQLVTEAKKIGLPKPREQFRIITKRSFNSIQFLELILENEIIEEIVITIYSINFKAAQILVEMVRSGRSKKMVLLMSSLRNASHKEKEMIINEIISKEKNIEMFFGWSHAKIFSSKTNKGNFYTFEGSGNMSYNARIEQYVIDNDKELFEFTKYWILEIKQYLKIKENE